MKKHLIPFLVLSLLISTFLSPLQVFADGVLLPQGPYPIYESGQKAAIFYQDGVEHLVLSVQFHGEDLNEFGWVVPVPSLPEVEKGDPAIFRKLGDMTIPKKNLLEKIMDVGSRYYYLTPMRGGMGVNSFEDSSVQVIEEKQVGILDVAVLKAEKVQDLLDWVEENGYRFPSSTSVRSYYEIEEDEESDDSPVEVSVEIRQMIQDYIDEDWYFILSKVNPAFVGSNLDTTTEDYYYGDVYDPYNPYNYGQNNKLDLTPLRISFETPDIIYPMRISSAGMTSQSILLYVFDSNKVKVSNYNNTNIYRPSYETEVRSLFTTQYSENIDRDVIDDLTRSVGKTSWLNPTKDMYLTKLYTSSLSYTDMKEDVLIIKAEDNKSVNAGHMTWGEWVILPLMVVIYLPFHLLSSANSLLWNYNMGMFFSIALVGGLIGVNLFFVIGLTLFINKVKKRFWRLLIKVLRFPLIWFICALMSLAVVLPFGFLMELLDVYPDLILFNSILLACMVSSALVLLAHRILGRKEK